MAGRIEFDDQATDEVNILNAWVGIGTNTPGTRLEVNGFTMLGSDSPKIKMMKITGTTAATEGAFTAVALGVSGSKVLSLYCLIEYQPGASYMPTESTFTAAPGYMTHMNIQANAVRVWNHATNSENTLSKPFKILVTYEE